MTKILIFGSNGFIGSNLKDYFLNANNFEVVALGNRDQYEMYFNNFGFLHEYDVIINAVGSANVSKSFELENIDFDANVVFLHKLLFAISKLIEPNRPLIIHLSSAAVYGNPIQLPIKETDRLLPLSPYGYNKLISENICNNYIQNFNLNIVILRLFSIYGPGQNKLLLWELINKIVEGQNISLYGNGTETRDYLFIEDFCAIVRLIIESRENAKCQTLNICSGTSIQIQDLVNIILNLIGEKKLKVNFMGDVHHGNPSNWRGDNTKLRELGFQKFTSLNKGVRLLIDYIINEKNRYIL